MLKGLGLKLEVLGGMTGERGTVTFSHGIAAQLDTFLKRVLDSEGFLENRMEGLNNRIDALGEQREDLERRIGALEQRCRTQFTTLDSLFGQLQTTSDFLSQQIATYCPLSARTGSLWRGDEEAATGVSSL